MSKLEKKISYPPINIQCAASQPSMPGPLMNVSQSIYQRYFQSRFSEIPPLINNPSYYINWNEKPLHFTSENNINLAWLAMKEPLKLDCLFKLLLRTPTQELLLLDWNASAVEGESIASMAMFAAFDGKPQALNKLLELPDEILMNLNWDTRVTLYQQEPQPLHMLAIYLEAKVQSNLVERLQTFPPDKIHWNPSSLEKVFSLVTRDSKPYFFKLIMHPVILSSMDWNELRWIKIFSDLYNKIKHPMIPILVRLPDKLLQHIHNALALLSNKSLQLLRTTSPSSIDLLNHLSFIIQLKSDAKLTPQSTFFSTTSRGLTNETYFAMASAASDPDKALHYYSKVSTDDPDYANVELKLTEIYFKKAQGQFERSISSDSKTLTLLWKAPIELDQTQPTLEKALCDAFKWFYYDKKKPAKNKAKFIYQIIFQFFKNFKEQPPLLMKKVEKFLTELLSCEPKAVQLKIDIFIQSIKTEQLVLKKAELTKLTTQPGV